MSGKLYVVATPIGNLGDLSPRAQETLASVDFIAAEDTRVTAKILNHINVKKPLISCQKYNEHERAEQLVKRMLEGENCAFCSDAGTPVISDPGGVLVSAAMDAGITVVPVSGASGVMGVMAVRSIPAAGFSPVAAFATKKPGALISSASSPSPKVNLAIRINTVSPSSARVAVPISAAS